MIELLVVVAIISLLAALLLPALKKARDKAKAVACANNLRQLYIGVLSYADDFNGALPALYPDGCQCVVGIRTWSEMLYTKGYLRNFGLWACPTYPPYKVTTTIGGLFPIYGLRLNAAKGIVAFSSLSETEGAASPTEILYIADSIGYGTWYPETGSQVYYLWGNVPTGTPPPNGFGHVHQRHVGAANCLFADGHVQACGALAQMGYRAGLDFTANRF